MRRIGLWHVTDNGPLKLKGSGIDLEKHLEEWIESDPDLLQAGLKVVGRQVDIEAGRLDLLAIDIQGRWVVIEIKAGTIYRETVAQALDYASCVATMPYDELSQKANTYLETRKATTGDTPIEELLDERQAEDVADETRDVLIFVVGTGRAPGLERMVDYLSGTFDVPISVVSYQVYETSEGQRILVRELTEPETTPPVPARKPRTTVEEICARADQSGTGREFRAILEAARKHNLYPRPYKQSIMYTAPAKRTRMLFTVWISSKTSGEPSMWIAPDAFAEFYPPLTEEEATSILGPSGGRTMTYADVEAFLANLDRLFERIEQGTEAHEEA